MFLKSAHNGCKLIHPNLKTFSLCFVCVSLTLKSMWIVALRIDVFWCSKSECLEVIINEKNTETFVRAPLRAHEEVWIVQFIVRPWNKARWMICSVSQAAGKKSNVMLWLWLWCHCTKLTCDIVNVLICVKAINVNTGVCVYACARTRCCNLWHKFV